MRQTINVPPGLNTDDTTFSAAPAWADICNMRFRLKLPETIGGWESMTLSLLNGVCRAALAWTENAGTLDVAFGTHKRLQVCQDSNLSDITPFGPPVLLAAGPLSVTNGSAVVSVSAPAHGYAGGIGILVSGAVSIGGITPNGGPFAITVLDADSYSYVFTSPATSTVPAAGGSAVVIVPQVQLPDGAADGSGSNGFGSGSFGVGAWGQPSTSDFFPRTWSLAAWGQKLAASPRNGGLYIWSNSLVTRAVAVPTAPTQITQILVSGERQIFALGCTQENGLYNSLCIRHCSVGDETVWATAATSSSTAREYILPGGGRIVGGKVMGKYILVWTTTGLFLGTYVGQVNQVWRFDRVGDKCGLIGPNAAAVIDTTAFWMSGDRQFHSYALGGSVLPIECPIRRDFSDNLTPSQADKICASTIAEFSEVRWDYPDKRDGLDNSRYLALSIAGSDAGCWYRGRPLNGVLPARTAMIDAGPALYPVGVTAAGNVYWHEKGHSADGAAMTWLAETADLYMGVDQAILVRELWPDFGADHTGAVTLTMVARLYPDEDDVESVGPFAIAPKQGLEDFKISGRLFKLTYSGFSAPSFARLGPIVVDVKARGRRG